VGQFALHPYELGAFHLAVILKVVGIHQSRRVVLGVGEDGAEEDRIQK
jgi:hypothetical protein